MIIIGIILICLALLAVLLFNRSKAKVESKRASIIDPGAQALYNQKKHKNDKEELSLKDRVELSWKFLYDITEIIINKFSKEDKQEVNEAGKILVKQGARYEHVVNSNLGIKQEAAKGQNADLEKHQGKRGI